MKNIIMVGGGGFCKSVIDVAEDAGYHILGVFDMPEEVGKDVLSYKIIGTDDDIPTYVGKASFVITVGHIKDSSLRRKIYKKIKDAGGDIEAIIAKDAYVSPYAKIGEGSLIMHKAMLSADVEVGVCSIINSLANVSHDAKIGDFCHISTCASVNGACEIGDDTFIGSQTAVNQGVKIVGGIVASQSLVNKDLLEKGVYVGCPAKMIKQL
jgi:sugar O-acyltransferase (sialic acid O-acetyltransferase NeuD family)